MQETVDLTDDSNRVFALVTRRCALQLPFRFRKMNLKPRILDSLKALLGTTQQGCRFPLAF